MSITLYQNVDFEGTTLELGTAASRLQDFNDEASSCIIHEGTWILYSDSDFQGEVSILAPGKYANPVEMGISNDKLSSLFPFPAPSRNSILIFQDFGFKGRVVHVTGTTSDLRVIGFNDKASSALVLSGAWRLYKDVGLSGEQFDLPPGPGEYPRAGENDALSSIEALS